MWIALDLDQTLIDAQENPYVDTVLILDTLKAYDFTVVAVSYNLHVTQILERLGWNKYFTRAVCDRTLPKSQIIKNLAAELQLPAGDALLVDDLESNITDCLQEGIDAWQVDPATGFTFIDLRAILRQNYCPTLWLSAIAITHRSAAKEVFGGYHVRYHPLQVTAEQYSSNLRKPVKVVGSFTCQHDVLFGDCFVLELRDLTTGVTAYGRSASFDSWELSTSLRINMKEVVHHLYLLSESQLVRKLKEFDSSQMFWDVLPVTGERLPPPSPLLLDDPAPVTPSPLLLEEVPPQPEEPLALLPPVAEPGDLLTYEIMSKIE